MEHFKLQFFSMKFGFIFDIGYSSKESKALIDLLSLLNAQISPKYEFKVNYKHQYTTDFQEKLNKFIENYKAISPSIQGFKGYFNDLERDEWFFTLPPVEFNTKARIAFERELDELNGEELSIDEENMDKLFECVLDNYEIVNFNLQRKNKIKIGQGLKKKRVCRFCNKKMPEVTFKNEAHAISEALGNKKLIINEECDSCNRFFDENIERDFINYHDLARTMLGVKNKDNKKPKMKGQNFKMHKGTSDLSIVILENIDREDKSKPPTKITLETNHKIRIQNLYKTLCKFALSAIDTEHIKYFKTTIKWLKNELVIDQLPKIAILLRPLPMERSPEIILYCRNNDNMKLPYLVGEFRFTFYTYVFIIPLCNKDDNKFISTEEFEEFLNCFKQVKNIEDIDYVDYSQNIERKIQFNINFEKIKD